MKIYVNAFPKSGVTWLIHLLSDLFQSPQTGVEIKTPYFWGPNRGGNHEIIKQHVLAKDKPKDGKIVLIIRDPKDVAVSKHFYNGGHPDNLINSIRAVCRWYEQWHKPWLDGNHYDYLTRYELLHTQPEIELRNIAKEVVGVSYNDDYIKGVIKRHSFRDMKPAFDKIRKDFLRKGIVGDWENYFKLYDVEFMNDKLGSFMDRLGY